MTPRAFQGTLTRTMRTPRPEAGTRVWADLTDAQKEAAVAIQEWVARFIETVRPLPRKKSQRSVAPASAFEYQRVDRLRNSNVVLIDGDRGSGKTTLMLTLLETWRAPLAGEPIDELFEGAQQDERWTRLNVAIGGVKGNAIPLRILDLQPLPASTSLVSWIASAVYEFLEHLDGRVQELRTNAAGPVESWHPDWNEESPARRAWRDIIDAAASGWDDNLNARKPALDPEAYAEELKDAELARQRFARAWTRFVDEVLKQVVADARVHAGKRACLVIPIDDADMNPRRCSQLLDLLRMLWHPRVVFMLTGDSALFLKTLEHEFLATFSPHLEDVQPSSRELAMEAYDKVVPYGQRFAIPAPTPERRLELVKKSVGARRDCRIVRLLQMDPWAQESLPASMRELQNVIPFLETTKSHHAIAALWRLAVDRLPDRVEREALREAISARGDTFVVALSHRLVPADVRWSDVRLPHGGRIRVGFPARLDAFVYGDGTKEKLLPRRLSGVLALAADRAVGSGGARFLGASVGIDGMAFPAASGWSGAAGAFLAWPLPDLPAPLDFARFGAAWSERTSTLLSNAPPASELGGALAAEFLASVLQLLPRQEPQTGKPQGLAAVSRALATAIAARGDGVSRDRERAIGNWFTSRALLVAAPESGLDEAAGGAVLTAFRSACPKELWNDVLKGTRRARRERASQAGQTDPEQFVRTIDEAHPDHLWAAEVEERPREARGDAKALRDILGRLYVTRPAGVSNPRTLVGYLPDPLLAYLQSRPRNAIRELVTRLATAAELRNGAHLAIEHLWRFLREQYSPQETAGWPKQLGLRDPSRHWGLPEALEEGWHNPASRRVLQDELPLGSEMLRLVLFTVAPPKVALPEPVRLLLEAAHDVKADEDDGEARADMPYVAFPFGATSVRLREHELLIDWPVPSWRTFLDWRLMEQAWTQAWEGMRRSFATLDVDFGTLALSAIAHTMLEATLRVAANRDPDVQLHAGDLRESWRNIGGSIAEISGSRRPGARWRALADWSISAAPLYAAPESGLPPELASAFLDGWRLRVASDDDSWRRVREEVRKLRTKRLIDATLRAAPGRPVNVSTGLLLQLEHMEPEHPWHAVFGNK